MKHAEQTIVVPAGKTVHITIPGCDPAHIHGPVTLEINPTEVPFITHDAGVITQPAPIISEVSRL